MFKARTIPGLMLVVCLALGLAQNVLAQGKIQIGSDEWCPYICSNGKDIIGGFLVDATDEIFSAAGYHVNSHLLPLNRAMIMAEVGAIDGIYAPILDNRLIMTEPLMSSRACFYTRKESKWIYKGIASLQDVTVSVIDDYGYDDGVFDAYVAKAKEANSKQVEFRKGDDAGPRNIEMLLLKRFPIMIEHEAVIAYLLKLQGPAAINSVRSAGCLERPLPLVIGFGRKNPNAQSMVHAINTGLDKLRSSGHMAKLKARYGILD